MNEGAPSETAPKPARTLHELARKHLRIGWWSLLVFLSLGVLLEALHGFKVGYYLDAGNETRRLSFRLAHAHGALLSLVHVAFALTLASRVGPEPRAAERASPWLVAALVLLPGGFLLGGLFPYGGDPGLGVLFVPFGALALFAAVLAVARGLARGRSDPPDLELRELVHGSPEYDAGVALRMRVLREPLGLERKAEEHDEEAKLVHLGAFEGSRLVGCLMLHDQGDGSIRMRQVAVAFDHQRRGIGTALVARSEELARGLGFSTMLLHARETAVPFYVTLGYEAFGDPFVEVTIPHRKMRKRLG